MCSPYMLKSVHLACDLKGHVNFLLITMPCLIACSAQPMGLDIANIGMYIFRKVVLILDCWYFLDFYYLF